MYGGFGALGGRDQLGGSHFVQQAEVGKRFELKVEGFKMQKEGNFQVTHWSSPNVNRVKWNGFLEMKLLVYFFSSLFTLLYTCIVASVCAYVCTYVCVYTHLYIR